MKFPKLKFKSNSIIGAHTKGTLYALVLTLTGVLLFALLVKYAGIPNSIIKPVIQGIKAISIFTGVYAALKSIEKRAWLHGGILGIIYTVLAFFVLSIIDNNFSITGGFFIEAAFALVVGALSAMLLRLRKRQA